MGAREVAGTGVTVKKRSMQEIRCGNCNRLLAKGEALNLSIKCPKCGTLNHVRAASPKREGRRAPGKELSHEDHF